MSSNATLAVQLYALGVKLTKNATPIAETVNLMGGLDGLTVNSLCAVVCLEDILPAERALLITKANTKLATGGQG